MHKLKLHKTIGCLFCLIATSNLSHAETLYNFNLQAREEAFSLFEDIVNENQATTKTNKNKSQKKSNDQHIEIKWSEKSNNSNQKYDKNTDTVEISTNNNSAILENTKDTNNSLLDWFSVAKEPDILKNRELKTTFRKGDPYYGKHLCNTSEYSCVAIKKNDSWKSLFPDKYQRELMQRINRTNKGLWNRNWILVPNDINRDYMDYSPLPDYMNTDNQKTILIDISELAFGAYDEDGDLVHWGPVNPGKAASKTVRGDNFQIYRKGGADCWSKKYESYIPYCLFFHKGFALHGYAMPGYPASHGCVRIYVDDALWLNKIFANYKTRVIVQD